MMANKTEQNVKPDLMSVPERLQMAKVELQSKGLKKTGHNEFAKFNYFTLDDFLPSVNEIFLRLRLYSRFWIEQKVIDGIIYEYAHLKVSDFDNPLMCEETSTPTAEWNNPNPIQALGGKHTYMRRYLYMNLLDISETDIVDASQPTNAKVVEAKATDKQAEIIRKASVEIPQVGEMMTRLKVEKPEDLTREQASTIISWVTKQRKGNGNGNSEK